MFFLLNYKSHMKETLSPLQEGYGIGLEVGNLEYAGYNAHGFCLQSFWSAQPLAELEQAAHTYFDGLVQLNQLVAANWCRSCWISTLNLLGIAKYPTILSRDTEQEEEFISQMVSVNDSLGLSFFYLYKMMLCYLFEKIESIEKDVEEIKGYVLASPGLVTQPLFSFYDSLIALASLSKAKNKISEVKELRKGFGARRTARGLRSGGLAHLDPGARAGPVGRATSGRTGHLPRLLRGRGQLVRPGAGHPRAGR
ncbi:hypothetical protein AFK68_29645 [Hydrocoleum sp. CS-953]|nr:hypothetical protein AFK68_29645 [Hydrocoleum sp. CS-953]